VINPRGLVIKVGGLAGPYPYFDRLGGLGQTLRENPKGHIEYAPKQVELKNRQQKLL
jgi:hypothetical protein